jgi:formylglycine-generating enzyme required for sulfatase activity
MRPTQTSRLSCSSQTLCASVLVLGLLATSTRCQAAAPNVPGASGLPVASQALQVQPKAQPAVAAKQPQVAFPVEMLPVGQPGTVGTAPLGISAEELWTLTRHWYENDMIFLRALKNAASELGRKDVPVDPFFLYKYPITNKQYEVFVKKTGHRSPFHWWKWGNKENFRKHSKKIAKFAEELEKQHIERREAEIRYWDQNAKDLEYAIPEGTENHPVVFVSHRDAMKFCGWAGMRLPTEAEWTYAASGGKRKIFLFGNTWDPDYPKKVGLGSLRDRTTLKPVGFLGPNAAGPFGHMDMLGQVWEWGLAIGYGPQAGNKIHEKEYEKLRRLVEKDKRLKAKGRSLPEAIAFNDDRALAKGSGSIFSFSYERWDQLRMNVRAPLSTDQTVEGLGFRPAKSYRVALDMTLSRLRSEYLGNQYFLFGKENQTWNLDAQDGIERYDLADGGRLITDYHAISFTPTNFLTTQKSLRPKALEEHTRTELVILGPLITTEKLKQPALDKGIYTVYYRHAGLPKELVSALKEGCSVLRKEEQENARSGKAARHEKAKGKEDTEPDAKSASDKKKNKKKQAPDWRKVIEKYGFRTTDFLDEEGMVSKNFWKEVDYVYLKQPPRRSPPATDKKPGKPDTGDKKPEAEVKKVAVPALPERLKIPAEKNSLMIFRDNDGRWVGFNTIDKRLSLKYLRGAAKIPKPLMLYPKKLTPAEKRAGMAANELVEFNFAIPPTVKDANQRFGAQRAVFKLVLELPDPPSADRAWRTNYQALNPRADAPGNGNGDGKAAGNGKSNGGSSGSGR